MLDFIQKKVCKSEDIIDGPDLSIANDMIVEIDFNIVAHFGNPVCPYIHLKNNWIPKDYNCTRTVGYMLNCLVELLGIEEEDGLWLSKIKNVPCRVIIDKHAGVVAIGNFLGNRFIRISDLLSLENPKRGK